jgi:hypothetical protein
VVPKFMGSLSNNNDGMQKGKRVPSEPTGSDPVHEQSLPDLNTNSTSEEAAIPTQNDSLTIQPEEGEGLIVPITVFTLEETDKALIRAGSSLARLKGKLEGEMFSCDLNSLKKLSQLHNPDDIRKAITSYPTPGVDHFPLAYNLISEHFSVPEYIEMLLEPQGTWERSKGLMKWMPLYRPHVGDDGIGKIIEKLRTNETDCEEDQQQYLYRDFALHADYWLGEISGELAEQLFQKIRQLHCDYGLVHCLPTDQLPTEIAYAFTQRYLDCPINDVPTTDFITPVTSQNAYAGTCGWCQELHHETLADHDSDVYGNVAILRINGQAVFSLKLNRDSSMVALRSFRTADGKFGAVKGCIYVPPKEIRAKFDDFDYETEKFRIFDLEEPIKILPLGWVDSVEFEWSEEQFAKYKVTLSEIAESHSD